ncbi:MAG TPA: methyltransferase domain-containing protein, partial [Spirochaetia bacterium]|nr:methyltransferase domain-containing protein [Spirochaetia bacterium]
MTPAHLLEERTSVVPHSVFGLGSVEVEIGCGNGHFLCEYAAGRPGTTLVGIDIKKKRCIKAREKAERRGHRNILIVNASAEKILSELPRGSVDAF